MSPMVEEETLGHASPFTIQPHGHRDMVQASAFNAHGTRFAIGSVDGKIKVYDRSKDGSWILCDTWGAHSGEVIEIHWFPPTISPSLLASLGSGGKFRLWAEDPTFPPNKGRRFNSSRNLSGSHAGALLDWRSPSPRNPYLSFDISHNPETRHTFLALLDRSAMLTVHENEEPENVGNWTQIDQWMVLGEKPARGEEVAFKVRFDPNLEPSYAAIREGVPRDSLAVIVAGMNTARIWRSKVVSHEVSLGAGSTREFYLAADLPGHRGLVRDVAWAPGSIRGFDIVATASKDGFIRVFEVTTPPKDEEGENKTKNDYSHYPVRQVSQRSAEAGGAKAGQSGIGAGLATARLSGSRQQDGSGSRVGEVPHVVKEVERMDAHRGGVWKVKFDADGQMLGTTGDDGKLMLWRRVPGGGWSRSGELALDRSVVEGAR